MVAVIVASATGDGDAAASCDESTGDAERGAGGDEDAGEADWATYQAQSRQCTSHSVVSVFIICSSRDNNNKPRAAYVLLAGRNLYTVARRECDHVEVLTCE